jgi:hypothetical protein
MVSSGQIPLVYNKSLERDYMGGMGCCACQPRSSQHFVTMGVDGHGLLACSIPHQPH